MYLALSTVTTRVVPSGEGTVTFCTGTSTARDLETFTRFLAFHVDFITKLLTDGYGHVGSSGNGSKISSESQHTYPNSERAARET